MTNPILIVGATSDIARAVADRLASAKHDLILTGRDVEELGKTACDLRVRHGVQVEVVKFDALAFADHPAFWEACLGQAKGDLAGVVLCHGFMAPQAAAQDDFSLARQMIDVNYTSAVSVLNLAATYFERRKSGFLCAISSVAGDRGRQSNYLYGATKAALNTYLDGLYNRLWKVGVSVTNIRPGFVDTKMTRGQKGMFLVARPERVARDVCRAIERRARVAYTPWFWWGIMAIIRNIPSVAFRRLSI
jgi:short-subunit dehydrogenase